MIIITLSNGQYSNPFFKVRFRVLTILVLRTCKLLNLTFFKHYFSRITMIYFKNSCRGAPQLVLCLILVVNDWNVWNVDRSKHSKEAFVKKRLPLLLELLLLLLILLWWRRLQHSIRSKRNEVTITGMNCNFFAQTFRDQIDYIVNHFCFEGQPLVDILIILKTFRW